MNLKTETESEIDFLIELRKSISENLYLKDPEDPIAKQCSDFLNQINSRLRIICNHTIVSDIIDIDPDISKQVFYCKKCELTF